MESNIKIKATIPAMYKFFREDSGVRYYEIKDKRYTNAEIKSMPDAERNSEKFVFSVIYRHMELNKPLSGTFTIETLKKRWKQRKRKERRLGHEYIKKAPFY